jgi:hypothetical protein
MTIPLSRYELFLAGAGKPAYGNEWIAEIMAFIELP